MTRDFGNNENNFCTITGFKYVFVHIECILQQLNFNLGFYNKLYVAVNLLLCLILLIVALLHWK